MKRNIDTGIANRIALYSDAVQWQGPARYVTTSGTPGFDPDGKLSPDFATQAEWAWKNVLAALKQADMDVGDIVKVTQYIVSKSDAPAYRPIREKFLGDARPASMLLYGMELPWPEMLIEIQVDAMRPISG
ncbi:MAG: endoribonuclease family protein 15 [Alphaproteobacteria bacterium]|jgi:enamine deaminase RidA (YjgF/YER057c/UK114 family)|nr:endoribonuclease family protein 15 [Alphaproteobacteria bacterium]